MGPAPRYQMTNCGEEKTEGEESSLETIRELSAKMEQRYGPHSGSDKKPSLPMAINVMGKMLEKFEALVKPWL